MTLNRTTILGVIGVFVFLLGAAYAADRYSAMRAEQRAKLHLNLAVTKTENLVNQTHKILFDLSRTKAITTRDRAACTKLLKSYAARYKEYNGFLLADANGDVVCSNHPLTGPVTIADRSHFKAVMENGKFVSGEWIISRLNSEAILPFGYPVLDSNGRVGGMIGAGLNVAWLSEWAGTLGLPAGARFWLAGPRGMVIAHYPKPERVGEDVSEAEVFSRIEALRLEGKTEGVFKATGLDEVRRVYAFRTISDPKSFGGILELYVVVGIR